MYQYPYRDGAISDAIVLFSTLFPMKPSSTRPISLPQFNIIQTRALTLTRPINSRLNFWDWADDGDADGGGHDDYGMDDDEVEEVDNMKDFNVDYNFTAALATALACYGGNNDITMVQSNSFVSTEDWTRRRLLVIG